MTGNFLEACRINWFHLTQRARGEERRVQRKKSAQRREKSWRDTLCSGVDTTEGSNEGRKERRKEEWAEDRGILWESRAWAREVSEVARISRLVPTTRRERRRRRNVVDAPWKSRTTCPVDTHTKGRRNKPWKRDEILPGNAINRPDGRRRDSRSARRAGEAGSDGALSGENLIWVVGLDENCHSPHERWKRAFESITGIADRSLRDEIFVRSAYLKGLLPSWSQKRESEMPAT